MIAPNYQLSDFQVLQNLGQGSFSKVKLVKRIQDGKILAMKHVSMDKLNIVQKNSALNQIRLLASIKSPYIISYQGSFYSSNTSSLCLLMEYADNGDLQKVINNTAKKTKMQKGISQNYIWRTIIHLLKGLKTLHDNKIVHRDIKTANIFYSKGIAKLGDLNVSSVSDCQFYSTKTGTPYYTAPQIWKGEKYTTNCDIWSLGCIVYEMCALLPPFRAQTFPELFVAVSKGQYPTLSQDYSEDLRTFIRMCLNVNQFERPSASQLLTNSLLIKRFCDFKDDIDYSGKVDLIKPIKCPKVLRFINSILPQNKEKDQDEQSVKAQHNKTFKTQTRIKDASINKNTQIKSSIRIKSCKRIKPINECKSIKCIQDKDQKTQIPQNTLQLKSQPSIQPLILKQNKTVVKNQKFRLRSCKRINQKQNIGLN